MLYFPGLTFIAAAHCSRAAKFHFPSFVCRPRWQEQHGTSQGGHDSRNYAIGYRTHNSDFQRTERKRKGLYMDLIRYLNMTLVVGWGCCVSDT